MPMKIIRWLVGGLLVLYLSFMQYLMSRRNPPLELLQFWFEVIGLGIGVYGFGVARKKEFRLGTFHYQGKDARKIGVAICALGFIFAYCSVVAFERLLKVLDQGTQ
jgi:hypothetical protein